MQPHSFIYTLSVVAFVLTVAGLCCLHREPQPTKPKIFTVSCFIANFASPDEWVKRSQTWKPWV